MKLRNKKTGEVVSLSIFGISLNIRKTEQPRAYHSLADLNAEWEDYKPKEPLIKDEKIRKTIRAWADENDTTVVEYKPFKNEFVDGYLNIIGFDRRFNELCDKSYTITELCGEEDENV